jgi:hypothetical protein
MWHSVPHPVYLAPQNPQSIAFKTNYMTSTSTLPHIGQMLSKHIRKFRLYRSALARDIGVRRESIDHALKQDDMKLGNLWRICYALKYNFIADMAAQLPPEMPCAPTAKDARIAELEKTGSRTDRRARHAATDSGSAAAQIAGLCARVELRAAHSARCRCALCRG